tara:strand:+ start:1930 stop:4428 length:2499 start_codon:yes stop_codon:yes gene_type:complete
MSDYGINLKVSSNGGAEIKKLFDQFKNLERQVDATQSKLKSLNEQNKKIKAEQNALTATIAGFGEGVKVTATVLKAFTEIFVKNKKAIKDNNKAIRENRAELKAAKEARQVAIKQQLDETKAFQQSSNTIMKSSRQLDEYIKQLYALKAAVKGGPQKQIISDSITKADFTKQFRDLEALRDGANRVARAYSMMFQGKGGLSFGRGKGISELLQFDPGNTEKAINSYINLLRGLQVQLDKTSQEYRETTSRIQQMNQALNTSPFDIKGVSAKEGDANLYGPKPSRKTQMFSMPGGMFYERGGMAARKKGALNSALIGGAFPALFGQGLGASIGGGLGGGIGGMLGGGLGFGLSLVGTQIGAQVDALVNATKKTGDALGDLTQDADVLVAALGNTNNALGQRVKLIKQADGSQAAFAEAVKQTTSIVGVKGVKALKLYGDETREIQTGLAQIFLQFQSGLAKVNQFLGVTKALADLLPRDVSSELQDLIKNPKTKNLPITGSRTNLDATNIAEQIRKIENPRGIKEMLYSETNKFRLGNLKEDAKELIKIGNQTVNNTIAQELFNKELKHQVEINNTKGYLARQEIRDRKKLNDMIREYEELVGREAGDNEIQRFKDLIQATSDLTLGITLVNNKIEELDRELIQLNDSGYQVVQAAEAIGSAFSESFKGIIKGTMSVREAFANMFSRIADHYLDMAAQMAAVQMQKGILSLFNFGTNPTGGIGMGHGVFSGAKLPTGGSINYDFFKASGGPVSGGSPYVVGERGPELFVPGSSGNIVPNHAMGGTNIVVNVDASGSEVQGNEGQAAMLGRAISSAVTEEIARQKRPGGLLSAA